MPSPRTARSSSLCTHVASLQRLLAPGRNDVIHARVGNHLAEVLVQIAADAERAVGERQIAPTMILRLAGQRGGVERLELLLRVREALVQVVDDLRLVGQRAQLGRISSRVPRSAASRRTSSG